MKKILAIVLFLISVFLLGDKVDLEVIAKSHFNIITISTVIIGFLFTSLSLLLSFFKEDLLLYLEDMNYMEKVYKKISYGIAMACITITICFFNLLFIKEAPKFPSFQNYFFATEVTSVIFVFFNFLLALVNVKIVIDTLRKEKQKERLEKRENETIKAKLNKKSNK